MRPRVGGLCSLPRRAGSPHAPHTCGHAPNHGGRATGRAPSGADTKIAVAPVSDVTTFALHSRTNNTNSAAGRRRRKKCVRAESERKHTTASRTCGCTSRLFSPGVRAGALEFDPVQSPFALACKWRSLLTLVQADRRCSWQVSAARGRRRGRARRQRAWLLARRAGAPVHTKQV